MCLDKVDEKPVVSEGVGYKVGYIREDVAGRKGQCFLSGDQQTVLPLSRWIKDMRTRPIRAFGERSDYPAGFHIFLKRAQAKRWTPMGQRGIRVVARVKFKDVQVTGTQSSSKVFVIAVARRICILKPRSL